MPRFMRGIYRKQRASAFIKFAPSPHEERSGLDVYLWTPTDLAAVAHMWAWGIDGIFTGDPGRFAGS